MSVGRSATRSMGRSLGRSVTTRFAGRSVGSKSSWRRFEFSVKHVDPHTPPYRPSRRPSRRPPHRISHRPSHRPLRRPPTLQQSERWDKGVLSLQSQRRSQSLRDANCLVSTLLEYISTGDELIYIYIRSIILFFRWIGRRGTRKSLIFDDFC